MSVTFCIGPRVATDLERPERWINLSNRNAADLLAWLGLPAEEIYGSIAAGELAARFRRRLWDEAWNIDPELPKAHAHRCVVFGRPAGNLRGRMEELVRLAELADDDVISWA